MVRSLLHLCLYLLMFIASFQVSAVPQEAGSSVASGHIPSRYIIVFDHDVDTDAAAGRLAGRFSQLQVNLRYRHALRGIAVTMPEALVSLIESDAAVAYVEQDVYVSINAQTLPTGINRINAELNAQAAIDGIDDRVDADIAILDSGIDLDHPDLNVYRYTYCNIKGKFITTCNDGDPAANDVNSHGTHVAGIAAALDNNSGVVGVAPGARLWAVKVLEDGGTGTGSQIIAGVDYVAAHADEIEVANMSLTGDGSFQALDDAIDAAVAAGVVFTLAAGNDHINVSNVFPAGNASAITVSALADYDGAPGGLDSNASDDSFASFSNYGAGVDIMAPGVAIRSTVPGGGLGNKSGTSMAAPHVAGAVALLRASFPAYSPGQIRQLLLDDGDYAPCVSNPDGSCGPLDPDGIQEPLLMLSCADSDADTICDEIDNCPLAANPDQLDSDLDLLGNVCDSDDDNDGLSDSFEILIGTNTLLADTDGDTISDFDEVAYDGDVTQYTAGSDLDPLSGDSDHDLFGDADDPVPLSFNFNDGDLAPLGAPDGVINAADYLLMQRLVLEQLNVDDLLLAHGDLYPPGAPDGNITLSDQLLLLRLLQQ